MKIAEDFFEPFFRVFSNQRNGKQWCSERLEEDYGY